MEYEPGSCNIGRAERRKRLLIGLIGFGGAAAVAVGSLQGLPGIAALALLLVLGFEGVHQYRHSFCAGFALAGIQDVSEAGDDRHQVTDPDARAADRRAAWRIHALSIASALVVTGTVLLARSLL